MRRDIGFTLVRHALSVEIQQFLARVRLQNTCNELSPDFAASKNSRRKATRMNRRDTLKVPVEATFRYMRQLGIRKLEKCDVLIQAKTRGLCSFVA